MHSLQNLQLLWHMQVEFDRGKKNGPCWLVNNLLL